MTEEYDKQPKCPECGYPVDDCHCNGDGNTVDDGEKEDYNWDYYDEPMDEDSWNIDDNEPQQEKIPEQQDDNQSQQNNNQDEEIEG